MYVRDPDIEHETYTYIYTYTLQFARSSLVSEGKHLCGAR